MNWQYLFNDTRARVYLLWAILVPIGFVATHFNQAKSINALWTIIAVAGLSYMAWKMPRHDHTMHHILLAWAAPIAVGMLASGVPFYLDSTGAAQFIGHLGAFWLAVMAAGHLLNGLADPPSGWYWFAAGINIIGAGLCWLVPAFADVQYLVAAVVSAWSMTNLWLFRSAA